MKRSSPDLVWIPSYFKEENVCLTFCFTFSGLSAGPGEASNLENFNALLRMQQHAKHCNKEAKNGEQNWRSFPTLTSSVILKPGVATHLCVAKILQCVAKKILNLSNNLWTNQKPSITPVTQKFFPKQICLMFSFSLFPKVNT